MCISTWKNSLALPAKTERAHTLGLLHSAPSYIPWIRNSGTRKHAHECF